MPTLSEAASKQLLAQYGVPVLDERTAADAGAAVAAAEAVGFPVVVKLCGDAIAHKTERGLVRLGLADSAAVRAAASEFLAAARPDDGPVELLVAPMVRGSRELIAGLVRDPQFGPCVMFGVGGVLAEALGDVAFRLLPVTDLDADDLLDDLATQKLLGPFRGEPAVDRATVAATLVGLARLAQERPDVASVDLNPLIVVDGKPIAVDALVELDAPLPARPEPRARPTDASFRALFEPRGVIVAGASTHPGKFGFVALHNILSSGYQGRVAATNLEATPVLGVETGRTVDDLPDGPWDLVFVCTPAGANVELLRSCARRGVRAAFLTSAGYGEAGEAGIRAQQELVALADELGILLAGPNGQGVVSTPVQLCAQIVAPYPPPGRIAIASQS
ncbi:MAG TPA: acetate--CoA ligase family protein, partial [Acidimicrobiia bacterium]|nr:acetate--CoA ligase family protein [Acidimicrobiia bacterium]